MHSIEFSQIINTITHINRVDRAQSTALLWWPFSECVRFDHVNKSNQVGDFLGERFCRLYSFASFSLLSVIVLSERFPRDPRKQHASVCSMYFHGRKVEKKVAAKLVTSTYSMFYTFVAIKSVRNFSSRWIVALFHFKQSTNSFLSYNKFYWSIPSTRHDLSERESCFYYLIFIIQ